MFGISRKAMALVVATAAAMMSFDGATAQNIGDVGQDSSGNLYTFGYDGQGRRVWLKGRQGNIVRERTIIAERFKPTIWTDPDGCEHWVMDDGEEGFMTPHVTRDGIPVCNRGSACGVVASDQLFQTDSYRISQSGAAALVEFFRSTGATAFSIEGHTDSRASDAYNMRLSQNRANAVAAVAAQAGARVVKVTGFGERRPRVPNSSAANMSQNRRVEIICHR